MSYKAESFKRVGNGKMGQAIKELAKSCDLRVDSYTASGWVLKDIHITVYGHVDDLKRFKSRLPNGVTSE